jgi:hypothetical protein
MVVHSELPYLQPANLEPKLDLGCEARVTCVRVKVLSPADKELQDGLGLALLHSLSRVNYPHADE